MVLQRGGNWPWPRAAGSLLLGLALAWCRPAGAGGAAEFHQKIEPLLDQYCYQCHGDGAHKGKVAFDELHTDQEILDPSLWAKVLNNVRAGIMPPASKPRLSPADTQTLENWIKYSAFGIDPQHPDPGRVTLRRLNRVEYRNTIRDLMGVDFDTETEFPPDDTGYGFDNIGDVLSVSPLLLEKYMTAATAIVGEAVPNVSAVIPEQTISGNRFLAPGGKPPAARRNRVRRNTLLGFSYYEPAHVTNQVVVTQPGTYRLALELSVHGTFDFDPGKCQVSFKVDGEELLKEEFTWENNKVFPPFPFERQWQPGHYELSFDLTPLTPKEQQLNSLEMRLDSVTIQGPMEPKYWTRPENYDRFFPHPPPTGDAERRAYARAVLGHFAQKAFRHPPETETVERLTRLAEGIYQQPGETFESGIAQAMVAVLASPRFLFRSEAAAPGAVKAGYPLIDEYSLASRLSYFLWSSMPDEELFDLAGRGELRLHLGEQVTRMLADPRAEEFVQNFTGQWLQTRDLPGMAIDSRVVLARDRGEEAELKKLLAERRARFEKLAQAAANHTDAAAVSDLRHPESLPPLFRRRNVLDGEAKQAMARETELVFATIVRENRSVLELLDSNYTFLNEKLAGIYGLANLGVAGPEMQRVTLPPDCPRGGVLTEGTVLVITSNPDRTSPVKRGLFVLSHILGSPPPAPPPNVPALEASESHFHDHEPTLRETLAAHRSRPECAGCHSRLDPLGLAFENFNALGMWRGQERHQAIDPAGQLISGERFSNVRELKHLLVTNHRLEFYRCLTAKLLTYAIGRGLEYYDTETVDQIARQLDQDNGRFGTLLKGIIQSAPFQNQRREPNPVYAAMPQPDPSATVNPSTRTPNTP